ncbi:MAG: GNAT family N-acetyltransferase [Armatimonadota bacterium]|nr:GNAT family N-acetyltransferase [Armatimonadota bacterium]
MEIQPIAENNVTKVWEIYQRNVAECDKLPLELFKYKVLGDPNYSQELSLAAFESDKPVAFMDAVVRTLDDNRVGFLKAWATETEYRGKGIATALLNRVEKRFQELGVQKVEAGWARPHYFTPGIDANAYTPAIAFLLRRGFTRTKISYNMDLALENRTFADKTLEKRIAEQGITVRRLDSTEKEAFLAWIAEDGWSQGWQHQVGFACDLKPPTVFVAEREERYLGFAAYDAVRPGWFGPMGTSQSLRGCGIGGALFLRCMDDMREKGYPICHICAVGPLYFYWKVAGAVVSRIFWIMEKNL